MYVCVSVYLCVCVCVVVCACACACLLDYQHSIGSGGHRSQDLASARLHPASVQRLDKADPQILLHGPAEESKRMQEEEDEEEGLRV